MKHIIDKSFGFCYGHRVHNQRLDTRFTESGDACLKCRHLHGHQGKIKVFLEEINIGKNIEKTGMVTDFKHLGWFKNFIDDVLDHKMILDLKDPLLKEECQYILSVYHDEIDFQILIKMKEGYWIPNLTKIEERLKDEIKKYGLKTEQELNAIIEKYEGLVFVNFVPTSENLTAWFFKIAEEKMSDLENIRIHAVEYWETPKSHCRVERN